MPLSSCRPPNLTEAHGPTETERRASTNEGSRATCCAPRVDRGRRACGIAVRAKCLACAWAGAMVRVRLEAREGRVAGGRSLARALSECMRGSERKDLLFWQRFPSLADDCRVPSGQFPLFVLVLARVLRPLLISGVLCAGQVKDLCDLEALRQRYIEQMTAAKHGNASADGEPPSLHALPCASVLD